MDEEKILEELKETLYWNECPGNAGYPLISVSNVEHLIRLAIKKGKAAQEREAELNEIKGMSEF